MLSCWRMTSVARTFTPCSVIMPTPGDKPADQILELPEAEAFGKPERDLSRVSAFCPKALAKVFEDEVVKRDLVFSPCDPKGLQMIA